MADKRFSVALSFPGEVREFVEKLADVLSKKLGQDKVLYDDYYEEEFARLDLDVYLPSLYREQSELIVVFLVKDYPRKRWCKLEWRHIKELIATEEQKRIMLMSFERMGDHRELGVLGGDGYVKIGDRKPEEIADLILKRLQLNRQGDAPPMSGTAITPPLTSASLKNDPSGEANHGDGVIIIGDVIDFSAVSFSPGERQEVLLRMWEFLRQNEELKRWSCMKDSTLDGAIVVFDRGQTHESGRIKVEALKFAVEWVRHMQAGVMISGEKRAVPFRVGLDFGEYTWFSLPGSAATDKQNFKIIGSAPNDCDRITRLGDAYDIVLSESFFELWKKDTKEKVDEVIFPKPSENPALQVFPKPNHQQSVRLYKGHRDSQGKKHEAPLALRKIQAATQSIVDVLKDVAEDYKYWLEEEITDLLEQRALEGTGVTNAEEQAYAQALDWTAAQLRVSVFALAPDEPGVLSCTQFRFIDGMRNGARKKALLQGRTRYSVREDLTPQGAVGRAYISHKPQAVTGLPEWKGEGKEYVKAYFERGLGMGAKEIRNFGRHARSFVAFPCILRDLQPPEAVVCVDAMNDGTFFDEKTYLELAVDLRDRYSTLLALLLQARR